MTFRPLSDCRLGECLVEVRIAELRETRFDEAAADLGPRFRR